MSFQTDDITYLNFLGNTLLKDGLVKYEINNNIARVQLTEKSAKILSEYGSINSYILHTQRLRVSEDVVYRMSPNTSPNISPSAQLAQRLKSKGILTASFIWKGVKWLIGALAATGIIGLIAEYSIVQPFFESHKGKPSPVDSAQNLNHQKVTANAANAKVKKPNQKKDSSESHKKNSVLKIVKSGVVSDTSKGN